MTEYAATDRDLSAASSVARPHGLGIAVVFDWALTVAQGDQKWRNSEPLPWDREVERFFASLAAFDAYLASDKPLGGTAEKLFQGPVADALTHTGQLAMLRRLAAAPVCSENFYVARIEAGKVDADQPAAVQPF